MVKYEWDESNGVSVPTNKLMVIDADEYYVGMPLKKVDAETVAPTDGDPEYICLAQRNAGDEIRPLQIPVQEVFPDAVYTKILEDGTEEKVKFGGGGAILDSNGKLKNEVLPDGYPYEEETYITIAEEQTVKHSTGIKSSIDGYCNSKGYLDGNKIVVGNTYIVYVDGVAYKGVAYKGAVSSMTKKVCIFSPNGNDYTYAPISITVGTGSGGTTCNAKFSDSGTHTVKVELYEYELEPLDPKFLPEGIGGGGGGDNLFLTTITMEINFSDGSSSTSCDKTYEQILDAYNGGKVVVLRYVLSAGDQQMARFYTSMVALGNNQEFMFRHNTPEGGLYSIYLYPDNTIEEDNTTLISGAEINNAGGLIMHSKTPGSEKRFRIEVDDNGTITATQV